MLHKTEEEIISIIKKNFKDDTVSFAEKTSHGYLINTRNEKNYSICFEDYENEDSLDLLTCFHSSVGFDSFYDSFKNIPFLDIESLNKNIFEIQFLHAYMTGVQFNKKINSIEDLKYYFQYDGTNYRHLFIMNEEENFLIDIFYILNLTTEKFEENIIYIYRNPKLNLNFRCHNFEDIKQCLFFKIRKKLKKEIKEISLNDHSILKLLNY